MKVVLAVLGFVSLLSYAGNPGILLINGKPVPAGTYKEVVSIVSGASECTATVVGPRAIITAAHCVTSSPAEFKIGNEKYKSTLIRSPRYPGEDHDIAIGFTDKEIRDVTPAIVGGTAAVGIELTLLGYGCTKTDGTGGNDGILRYGTSVVTEFDAYDMVSTRSGGAALCYGDSGGPAFVNENGKNFLLGINSKGNIRDTNYNLRVDIKESRDFLQQTATQKNEIICGINSSCGTPQLPPAPTCTLAAEPSKVKKGTSVTLKLQGSGEMTSAEIENSSVSFPSGSIVVQTPSIGTFTARASVTGPGGTGHCSTSYTVEEEPIVEPAPTCTLTATPAWITLGQSVILSISTKGKVTNATIDNQSVRYPQDSITVQPNSVGNFNVQGRVEGPGGSNTCSAQYQVGGGTAPETPDFALIPTSCGLNALAETNVQRVCLAVLKQQAAQTADGSNAVMITNRDGSQEGLLVLKKKTTSSTSEEWTVYANVTAQSGQFTVLETRTMTVTYSSTGAPSKIVGRNGSGQYFIIDAPKAP